MSLDSASLEGSAYEPDPSSISYSLDESFPDPESLPDLEPADRYRMNLWMLTQRDRPIPSLSEMKRVLEVPADAQSRRRRALQELEEDFEEDLDRMYMAESEDYFDEAIDSYHGFEVDGMDPEEMQHQLDELKDNFTGSLLWDHVYAHIHSTYQTKKKAIIDDADAAASAAAGWETQLPAPIQFPQNVEEYTLASPETQQIVAEFLTLTSEEDKEVRISRYGWAWWQTGALQNAFDRENGFRQMVQGIANGSGDGWSRDPRRRE
uniref:Uncharacterized protein n=1 Tax=Mycena chlorophos TaxID=658473 RepID=A0ABQ0LC95_MYCCL|nr:predicted protein [Mycena chlorophos]